MMFRPLHCAITVGSKLVWHTIAVDSTTPGAPIHAVISSHDDRFIDIFQKEDLVSDLQSKSQSLSPWLAWLRKHCGLQISVAQNSRGCHWDLPKMKNMFHNGRFWSCPIKACLPNYCGLEITVTHKLLWPDEEQCIIPKMIDMDLRGTWISFSLQKGRTGFVINYCGLLPRFACAPSFTADNTEWGVNHFHFKFIFWSK